MADEGNLADATRWGCVLLADAHQNILDGTRRLLESLFATVVMVSEQESLLETAQAMSPEVIVMDLSLPGKTSGNSVKRIVHDVPNVRIVVLILDNDRNVIKQLLASGAHAVVAKSSAGTDLVRAIEHAMDGITYVSPSVSAE